MAARFFWAKKWAESFTDSTARKNKGLEPPKKNIPMIHFVDADLKDVFEKGKHFNWPQPVGCPRCNHYRVWGHGFVERIFDSFCDDAAIFNIFLFARLPGIYLFGGEISNGTPQFTPIDSDIESHSELIRF